jgi:hypothetical protein
MVTFYTVPVNIISKYQRQRNRTKFSTLYSDEKTTASTQQKSQNAKVQIKCITTAFKTAVTRRMLLSHTSSYTAYTKIRRVGNCKKNVSITT